MNPGERVFDQRNFDDELLQCPKCGWSGSGSEAHIADFYGIGRFKQVSCPNCQEYLGNLSRDNSFGRGGNEPKRRP